VKPFGAKFSKKEFQRAGGEKANVGSAPRVDYEDSLVSPLKARPSLTMRAREVLHRLVFTGNLWGSVLMIAVHRF
jgi:hypothetical protein